MNIQTLDELKRMLCNELDEVAEKGELSAGGLETIHKLTDTIKNVYKIECYEEDMAEGYSRDGYPRIEDGVYRSRRYSRDGRNRTSYDDGNSYANRHWVRGHYSKDDGNEMMSSRIEEMIQDGSLSSNEKSTLKRALEILRK